MKKKTFTAQNTNELDNYLDLIIKPIYEVENIEGEWDFKYFMIDGSELIEIFPKQDNK